MLKFFTKFLPVSFEDTICYENTWLGVSCENQETADERIPILLQIPAAVRWVSCEPLLGEIYLKNFLGYVASDFQVDWIIVGSESGPKARSMELDWAKKIINDCKTAKVPIFMKQICSNGHKIPFEKFPENLKIREYPKIK